MFSQDELSGMVERYLEGMAIPTQPAGLYRPIRYTLEEGGKRLRPMLLVAGCNVFADKVGRALPCAAAVEVFHNFTLLHDDIMDNAALRRGKESVFKKWGANAALLSGDAMMIFAYHLLEKAPRKYLPDILSEFNAMALEVCEGQQLDMEFEGRAEVSTGEYIRMIELKTAALVARPLGIGALVGGAGEKECRALYEFGRNLGIAYQLQDDLLDTYGEQETFGKSIGGDIIEGKKTYLVVSAVAAGYGRELMPVLRDGALTPQHKIELVKMLFDKAGATAAARKGIAHYTALALETLAGLDAPEERKVVLRDVSVGLLNRSK